MRKHPTLRKLASVCLIAAGLVTPSSHAALASDDLGTLSDLLAPSPSKPTPRSQNGRVRIFNNFLVHPMPVWSRYSSGAAPAEFDPDHPALFAGGPSLRAVRVAADESLVPLLESPALTF